MRDQSCGYPGQTCPPGTHSCSGQTKVAVLVAPGDCQPYSPYAITGGAVETPEAHDGFNPGFGYHGCEDSILGVISKTQPGIFVSEKRRGGLMAEAQATRQLSLKDARRLKLMEKHFLGPGAVTR